MSSRKRVWRAVGARACTFVSAARAPAAPPTWWAFVEPRRSLSNYFGCCSTLVRSPALALKRTAETANSFDSIRWLVCSTRASAIHLFLNAWGWTYNELSWASKMPPLMIYTWCRPFRLQSTPSPRNMYARALRALTVWSLVVRFYTKKPSCSEISQQVRVAIIWKRCERAHKTVSTMQQIVRILGNFFKSGNVVHPISLELHK